ncbi:MAG: molybdate ABC transporter substrate-binding protein [Chloroflexi bacterium]|nr:molybdate ABC transporter substrate-binding protein [Chloroflexota bacterium]
MLLTIALLVASCNGNGGTSDTRTPLIFAAASLADGLGEAAAMYENDTGKRVDFSFGGSIALANQIALLGAPADGVFFVGEKPAEVLEDAGLLSSDERAIRLSNTLVVIGRAGEGPLGSLSELAARKARVAIGDPALAPAGVYTRQALKSAGIWAEISDRAIFAFDVRAAMAAVESGNVRYGIVYRTDAASSNSVSILYEIDGGHARIEYFGSALAGAPNAVLAEDFLEYVARTPETRTLFESAGFAVIAAELDAP